MVYVKSNTKLSHSVSVADKTTATDELPSDSDRIFYTGSIKLRQTNLMNQLVLKSMYQ